MLASKTIEIPSLTGDNRIIQLQRSSEDAYHDNQSCREHQIIKDLFDNHFEYTNEDKFIEDAYKKIDYIQNITERKNVGFTGFFTPKMECLVNDILVAFEVDNKEVTFIYDQGSHPINYFKGSINGMFISDAIDTAPKLTNSDQKPVFFETPRIIIPGSYIGFNEKVVRSVVFSDFRKTVDTSSGEKPINIFECKVVIEANLGGGFRWYDLATDFKKTVNKLTGYNILDDALKNADFKQSNSRDAGFFIGNKKATEILGNNELKPILALCLVVAKILGDFSSALAASPTLVETYDKSQVNKFIHASGDRLCSLEATRQGANVIKTSPRNEAGVIPFQYIPGTFEKIEINYADRVDKIQKEILKRFDDLIKDVEEFNIDKYKVDDVSINSENEDQLREYVESLKLKIEKGKADVKAHLETISGDPKEQYETLLRQKVSLMPQSSTISGITTTGKRKSLNMMFHLYTLPGKPSVSFYPKVHVYNILKSKTGGKRKFHQKRIRRTPRKSRGGMDTIQRSVSQKRNYLQADSSLITTPSKQAKFQDPETQSEYNSGTSSESSSGESTPNRKMSVVIELIDPTIEMDFPKDYIAKLTPEKKALRV
jgi:hypothetical protein